MFEPLRNPKSPRLQRSARRLKWGVGIGQLLGVILGGFVGYALSPHLVVTVIAAILGGAASIPLCWILFAIWSRWAHRVDAAESRAGDAQH
jgi:hypothetical protein